MCGIAGVVSLRERISVSELRTMGMAIRHRGPDDSGEFLEEIAGASVGFSHRRLSVLDLSSAGRQPMTSRSARFTMVYNGEIYNHPDLRRELEKVDPRRAWVGHSDTETLLAGFEEWGIEATIRRAVGMFAFAVLDRERGTVVLGRDRAGEKPLYHGRQGGHFFFASELKALVCNPRIALDLDLDSLAGYMRLGYVPGSRSVYRDVHKLKPGYLLTVELRDLATRETGYWSPWDALESNGQRVFRDEREAADELEGHLAEAVRGQCLSDVPLGVSLSGGVDSTSVVAFMRRVSGQEVRTYSIGFGEAEFNEAPYAAAVARHFGTEHTEQRISPDEALAVIPDLPGLYDEPFADSSQIATVLVSRLARQHVTVLLTGDGGDELFGGYNRHLWIRRLHGFPKPLRRAGAGVLGVVRATRMDRALAAAQGMLPRGARIPLIEAKLEKLHDALRAETLDSVYERLTTTWDRGEAVVPGANRPYLLAGLQGRPVPSLASEDLFMLADFEQYLPGDILCKVDRASMSVSLESRAPFLDHRLVEFAFSVPSQFKFTADRGKRILRTVLDRYIPRELVDRPKAGFAIPVRDWLRGPLRPWADALLDRDEIRRFGVLDEDLVAKAWTLHRAGTQDRSHHLWSALMLQAWLAVRRG